MTTINHHMTAYWLTALRQIAATRQSLRIDDLPVPPEMNRLHKQAVRNFAHCSIGHTFNSFEDACDFAAELSILAQGKLIAVTRLTKTEYNAEQVTEFAVYPDDSVPMGPGYVKVEVLTRLAAMNDGS